MRTLPLRMCVAELLQQLEDAFLDLAVFVRRHLSAALEVVGDALVGRPQLHRVHQVAQVLLDLLKVRVERFVGLLDAGAARLFEGVDGLAAYVQRAHGGQQHDGSDQRGARRGADSEGDGIGKFHGEVRGGPGGQGGGGGPAER
jgi:hypothetical protein